MCGMSDAPVECRFCGIAIRDTDETEKVGGSLVHATCAPPDFGQPASKGFLIGQWLRNRVAALVVRLQPRSSEGDVYRDEAVELIEVMTDAWGLFVAAGGALLFVASGQWLLGVVPVAFVAAMLALARVVFFRPHLVMGDETLVLVGVFRARRIAYVDVRRAVAAHGALKLVLTDGDEVYVAGHYRTAWWARGERYSYLAERINARIASRKETSAVESDH